jgi:ribosomal protein S18 acetylase RimI-like enzyme
MIKEVNRDTLIGIINKYGSEFIPTHAVKMGYDLFADKLITNACNYGYYNTSGVCVGIISYYANDYKIGGFISIIYVLKQSRGLGIGSDLINYCIDDLKHKKHSKVSLEVSKTNLEALKFYKSKGFAHSNTNESSYFFVKSL